MQPQRYFWGELLQDVSAVDKGNVCLSPLSAQLALAMTATGATGETQEQIYNVTQLDKNFAENAKELIDNLKRENEYCELKLANSIWINKRLNVKENFVETNKKYFDAEIKTIPFDNGAVKKINSWCKENTNGKIESIVDDVKPSDMMFLINALYFKAPWNEPFNSNQTVKSSFTTDNGDVVDVDMMKQTFSTGYYIDDVIQIAVKPFKEHYDMIFVLPRHERDITDAIKHLAANYDSCINGLERYRVDFSLPKFKCEYQTILNKVLCNMGMERAFSNHAEFDGISKTPLCIDEVIQKTYIAVDEEGAEAAAVTAVKVGLMAMPERARKCTMTLDRPFLYAIRDSFTGTILFIGTVNNPNQ